MGVNSRYKNVCKAFFKKCVLKLESQSQRLIEISDSKLFKNYDIAEIMEWEEINDKNDAGGSVEHVVIKEEVILPGKGNCS